MRVPSMTCFYFVFCLLFFLPRCYAGKKARDKIQNILMNAIGSMGTAKSDPQPLVLPWKKPSIVMEYVDILTFPDESEITDNHVCQCRVEEYEGDSAGKFQEGAI